ncbi:hypothetical protein EOM33_02100 [Candidatus Saccharibacteria bacterium]|nr:hypothetical protein [Candidatus Saccharibacteria bacterium]
MSKARDRGFKDELEAEEPFLYKVDRLEQKGKLSGVALERALDDVWLDEDEAYREELARDNEYDPEEGTDNYTSWGGHIYGCETSGDGYVPDEDDFRDDERYFDGLPD